MTRLNTRVMFDPLTGFVLNLKMLDSSIEDMFDNAKTVQAIKDVYDICPEKYHNKLTDFLNMCIRYHSPKVHSAMSIRTTVPKHSKASKYLSVHVYLGDAIYEFRAVRAFNRSLLTVRSKVRKHEGQVTSVMAKIA